VLRKVVADGELRADDPMGLRVASPFDVAGVPETAHLRVEGADDRPEALLLVRLDPLLGDREALVPAAPVDQPGDDERDRLAEQPVEERPEERVDSPLDVDGEERRPYERVQEDVAGVGRRQAEPATPA
jgi:hypothetical protein